MPAEPRNAEKDETLTAAIDSFVAARRRGEEPRVEEWAQRHAEVGEELRELLPSLVDLEIAVDCAIDEPAIPKRFGDCVVMREIGRGGMGVVYAGEQEQLGRQVAIKALVNAVDPMARERFLREARLAANLQHPNIVPIHGVGVQDGTPYLVMHYVQGKPLSALIGGPAQAIPALKRQVLAVQMIVPAARALAFAHAKGIWHRDIKPANLMRGDDGSIWVTDFGLARAIDNDRLTATGRISGTLAYMAPERLRGEEDARSDVYALGLTLLELASAKLVFEGGSIDGMMKRIFFDGPPMPRAHDPEMDPQLGRIIARAIAKSPDDRFAGMDAFVAALEAWQKGETPVLPAQRRLPPWAIPTAAVLALAALIVAWPSSKPKAPAVPEQPRPVAVEPAPAVTAPQAAVVEVPHPEGTTPQPIAQAPELQPAPLVVEPEPAKPEPVMAAPVAATPAPRSYPKSPAILARARPDPAPPDPTPATPRQAPSTPTTPPVARAPRPGEPGFVPPPPPDGAPYPPPGGLPPPDGLPPGAPPPPGGGPGPGGPGPGGPEPGGRPGPGGGPPPRR